MEARAETVVVQARKLMRNGEFEAAETLLRAAVEAKGDEGRLLALLLNASASQSRPKAFIESLRWAHSARLPLRLIQKAALPIVVRRRIPGGTELTELLLGRIPTSLAAATKCIKGQLLDPEAARNVLRFVQRATGRKVAEPRPWILRLDEGYKRAILRQFPQWSQAGRAGDVIEGIGIKAADVSALSGPLEADRSVVLLGLHGVPSDLINPALRWLKDKKVPVTRVGNGVSLHGAKADEYNLNTTGPNLAIEFAKLCKLIRKGRRIVRILPDGKMGGGLVDMQLGGQDLEVGLGAARLAYFGKSVLVFGRNRWTEGGLTADYWRGPEVTADMTPEDVEALTFGFFRDSFLRVLSDDPLNFGLLGGFWPHIAKAADDK